MAGGMGPFDIAGPFIGEQSAIDTQATVLKSALHFSSLDIKTPKNAIETGPAHSMGFQNQKRFNGSYMVNQTAEGVVTLDTFPAFLFGMFCARSTIQLASDAYEHTYTPFKLTKQMLYYSILYLYGTVAPSFTGALWREMAINSLITQMGFTISANAAPKFRLGWRASNEGPGAGGESLSLDDDYNMPIPSDPTSNDFTLPAWAPDFADLCVKSIDVQADFYNVDYQCLNSAEPIATVAPQDLTFTLDMLYTSESLAMYQYIKYLTTTPSANARAMRPGFAEGNINFTAAGNTAIPATDPVAYPSLSVLAPDVQWISADINQGSNPVDIRIVGKVFKPTYSFVVVNGKPGAEMAL